MSTGGFAAGIATIHLAGGESPGGIEAIRRAIATGGPTFFPRHRWFGDKARPITETSLVSVSFTEPQGNDPYPLALTIIDIAFEDGGNERYFVPLTILPGGTPNAQSLARLEIADDQSFLLDDAIAQPSFHHWLLDPETSADRAAGSEGHIVWRPGPGYGATRAALPPATSRVSGAEQSNSAVIFGTDLLAKVFRKLRPGLNPDIEISRFLSNQAEFRHFPELLGDLSYETTDGSSYSIGMILPFILNHGDAWTYTLSTLGDMLLGGTGTAAIEPYRLLGVRTGELHRALASSADDPAFAAEPITGGDVEGWSSALEQSIARTINLLRERSEQLPSAWRNRLARISVDSPAIARRIRGFRRLENIDKIRVHGDYHLGQVLVTLDRDFVILDFEGEPSRPMNERRAKTSPLKDVAGMLRSFSYARFAALRARPAGIIPDHVAASRLMEWEQGARSAFLSGYRSETVERSASFLPVDEADFTTALAAWSLDKAIYEVNYEVNNRPDWLPLPLEALFTADS